MSGEFGPRNEGEIAAGASLPTGGVASLDGVRMRAVATADAGEVDVRTIFQFTERETIVSASYAGGVIVVGHLVGVRRGSTVEFRYAQVNTSGQVDGGYSVCELSTTGAGLIRLLERFEWNSKPGSGSNVLEEMP